MDLGSHTFHLLSTDVVDGVLVPIDEAKVAVRMGERAFADGAISPSAWSRGLDAIEELLAPLAGRTPITVATSVFREASNAAAFLHDVRCRFGLDVRMLSGQEEAELTFRAVCAEMIDPEARIAVFDLGGGSLECILGERGRVELAASFPLGALRLATQVGSVDVASRVERQVMHHAGAMLDEIRDREPEVVVLTSGTARALVRVARVLGRSEPVVGCLSAPSLAALASRLATMSPSETARVGVPPARCDTMGSGATVLSTIVQRLGVPFVRVAQGALREGLALTVWEQHARAARGALLCAG